MSQPPFIPTSVVARPGVPGRDGSNVLPTDEAIAQAIGDTTSDTYAALQTVGLGARPALPHVPWIEGIQAWIFGHSYYAEGGDANTNQAPPHRVQRRLRHQVAVNRANAGDTLAQVLGYIKSQFVQNTFGLIHLCCLINNSNSSGIPAATTREQFRSCLAYLTARAKLAKNDTSFAYGSGWSAGVTSTAGSYVDFAWTGDAAYVAVEFTTGSATSVSITDASFAGPAQTINTGGWGAAFTGMIRLKGYGAGDHTVRIKLESGSGLTITGALIPSPNPPTVAWFREGPLPSYTSDQNTLLTVTYRNAIETILGDFPSVVKIQYDEDFDPTLHSAADGVHLNGHGAEYVAGLIVDALADLNWRHGQNNLNTSILGGSPDVLPSYVSPTPDFSGGGGGGGGTLYSNVVRWTGNWLYVDALPDDPSSFPPDIATGDHVELVSGVGWTPGVTFDVADVGIFGVGPGGASRRLIAFPDPGPMPPADTTGGTVRVTPA